MNYHLYLLFIFSYNYRLSSTYECELYEIKSQEKQLSNNIYLNKKEFQLEMAKSTSTNNKQKKDNQQVSPQKQQFQLSPKQVEIILIKLKNQSQREKFIPVNSQSKDHKKTKLIQKTQKMSKNTQIFTQKAALKQTQKTVQRQTQKTALRQTQIFAQKQTQIQSRIEPSNKQSLRKIQIQLSSDSYLNEDIYQQSIFNTSKQKQAQLQFKKQKKKSYQDEKLNHNQTNYNIQQNRRDNKQDNHNYYTQNQKDYKKKSQADFKSKIKQKMVQFNLKRSSRIKNKQTLNSSSIQLQKSQSQGYSNINNNQLITIQQQSKGIIKQSANDKIKLQYSIKDLNDVPQTKQNSLNKKQQINQFDLNLQQIILQTDCNTIQQEVEQKSNNGVLRKDIDYLSASENEILSQTQCKQQPIHKVPNYQNLKIPNNQNRKIPNSQNNEIPNSQNKNFKNIQDAYLTFFDFKLVKVDKQYMHIYHNAYISHYIISMICKKPKQYLDNLSLKQNILLMIKCSKICEESFNYFMKIFETGIQLNMLCFNQFRIRNGGINKNGKRLTVFSPSYIITQQIFLSILQGGGPLFITGHYGVSKTFSVILLIILCDNIVGYKMNNKVNKNEAKIMRVPKILYYNIVASETSEIQIFKHICSQLKQINPEIFIKNSFNLRNCKLNIEQIFYMQYDIQITFVIDQVNSLVSELRKLADRKQNLLQQRLNKTMPQLILRKQQVDIYQIQRNLQTIISIARLISLFSTSIALLSSVNIQKQFLRQIDLTTQSKHQQIRSIKINYCLDEQQTKKQILQYLIFEMGQRLKIQMFQDNWQNSVSYQNLQIKNFFKTTWMNHIQNIQSIFYTNHLLIREFFIENQKELNQEWKNTKCINKNNSEQIKLKIQNLLLQIINFSRNKFIDLIVQYMGKQKSPGLRYEILSYIFQHALINKEQNKTMHPQVRYNNFKKYIQNQKQFEMEIQQIDKNLITINRSTKTITLNFTIEFFIYIMNQIKPQLLDFFIDNYQTSTKLTIPKPILGYGYEYFFLNLVASGNVEITINATNSNPTNKNIQDQSCIHIKSIAPGFKSFKRLPYHNQKQQSYQFFNELMSSSIQSLIKQKIYRSMICIPFSKTRGCQLNFVSNNPSIDCIIVQFNPSRLQIKFYCYDLTVSSSSCRQKIEKFLRLYLRFKERHINQLKIDNKTYKVYLQYSVITPSKVKIRWEELFNNFKKLEFEKQLCKQKILENSFNVKNNTNNKFLNKIRIVYTKQVQFKKIKSQGQHLNYIHNLQKIIHIITSQQQTSTYSDDQKD